MIARARKQAARRRSTPGRVRFVLPRQAMNRPDRRQQITIAALRKLPSASPVTLFSWRFGGGARRSFRTAVDAAATREGHPSRRRRPGHSFVAPLVQRPNGHASSVPVTAVRIPRAVPMINKAMLKRVARAARLDEVLRAVRPQGPVGHLDGVAEQRVRGWAWDSSAPMRRLELEVCVDGVSCLRFVADQMRKDLAQIGYGDGRHGFDVALPAQALDGASHRIDIRFAGTRRTLTGCPFELVIQQSLEGLLTLAAGSQSLSGWAWHPQLPEVPQKVRLSIDDEVVFEGLTDRAHPVLTTAGGAPSRCAFSCAIPEVYVDGRPHVACARVVAPGGDPANGVELSGSPLSFRLVADRYRVHIDPVDDGFLSGWLYERQRPAAALDIEITAEGLILGRYEASLPRHDLAATAPEGNAHGFQLRLPRGARRIEIRNAASTELIGKYELVAKAGATQSPQRSSSGAAGLADDAVLEAVARLEAEAEQRVAPYFDAAWYLARHPSVAVEVAAAADARAGAWRHYRERGAAAGLSPNGWFDESWYRRQHPAVAQAAASGRLGSGFSHWLAWGQHNDLPPGPAIELASLSAEPGADPASRLLHWWQSGRWQEQGSLQLPAPTATVAGVNPPSLNLASLAAAEGGGEAYRLLNLGLGSGVYGDWIARLLRDNPGVEEARQAIRATELDIARRLLGRQPPGAPLVSIIMPTFNRAYVIAEAIQSVVEQSYANWELLVCDDGSMDKTQLVIDQFKDARIRYLKLEKSNGAVARNFGLKFAAGQYIAYLDSDNLWHPHFLALTLAALSANPQAQLLYTAYIDTEIVGTRLRLEGVKTVRFDYDVLAERNYIDLNGVLHRRELYDWLGGFDESLPRLQDWDLMLRYTYLAEPLGLPLHVVFYRRNAAWGQVTQLFAHQNIRPIVLEKSERRLSGKPEKLALQWLRRPVLTVVCADNRAAQLEALGLCQALSTFAELRLVSLGVPAADVAAELSARAVDLRIVAPDAASDLQLRDLAIGEMVIYGSDAPLAGTGRDGRRPFVLRRRHATMRLAPLDTDAPADTGLLGAASPYLPTTGGPAGATAGYVVDLSRARWAALREGLIAAIAATALQEQEIVLLLDAAGERPGVVRLRGGSLSTEETVDLPAIRRLLADRAGYACIEDPSAPDPAMLLRAAAALLQGADVIVAPIAPYDHWVKRGIALACADPLNLPQSLLDAQTPTEERRKRRIRAQRQSHYLYDPAIVAERLKMTIAGLLGLPQ